LRNKGRVIVFTLIFFGAIYFGSIFLGSSFLRLLSLPVTLAAAQDQSNSGSTSGAASKAGGAENKTPPEAAAKENPVKPSAESLAKGKKMYGIDCAMCHGKDGDGKGDMGGDFKNIPDFTKADTMKGRTDGELFNVTRNGKGDMPPEDSRAKDDDIWNMVNYVRAFAKK
jgi:mono/diheme cytochrome c family protein